MNPFSNFQKGITQLRFQHYVRSAEGKYQAGDFSGAIEAYTHAIHLDVSNTDVFINRGVARAAIRDFDGAIEDYDTAISKQPSSPLAYNNRGSAYHSKGDVQQAIEDYNQAIALDKTFVNAYNNRGWARVEQGDWDTAIADFDQTLQLDPNFDLAYINRGFTFRKKGDYERAYKDYCEAIRCNPYHAQAYVNRAWIYDSVRHDYDSAIADYLKAAQLKFHKLEGIYNNLGEIYFELGQFQGARQNFEKSLDIKPDYKWAQAGLAITYHKLERTSEAIALWRQLRENDSQYHDAEWVGKELKWEAPLIQEALLLIQKL